MSTLLLTEIWIYPVKSLGGIRLQSVKVLPKGLQHDRRFMLVDDQGQFLTQRVHPSMALFRPEIVGNELIVHHKGESLTIPLNPNLKHPGKPVQVWDDHLTAHELGNSFNEWFSVRLNFPCHLVSFPEENPRPVNPKYKVNDEHVSLADAYPFLIIGQSSLDDLNGRLEKPLPMNRFRPNFVFTGGAPFEEDTWRNFTVGTNRFIGVKPCDRCVLTTVNQDTGEKGIEPLKTLATYRKRDNKIYFGQNLVAIDHGQVSVGDVIRVDSTNQQSV